MGDRKFIKALVTGASSGIGEALARLLASKGISLILTGRNEGRLQTLADELNVECQIIVADLREQAERQILIDCIHQQTPDLVINNAGFGFYGKATDIPIQDQLDILTVNGNVVLELTLVAAKMMRQNHLKGTILNVSSAAAFQSYPFFAVYAASKTLVNAFSEALDVELKPNSIRVLAACPGMVSTAFGKRAAKGNPRPKRAANLVMTPEFVANQIWWQIQKGKPIHIINWKYRFATFLTRYLLPKSFTHRALIKSITPPE